MTLRLVKGAYWDSDTIRYRQREWPVPLFEHKAETDANYEALVRTLLEASDVIRPAFGTHNLRTLAYIEAMAEQLHLSPATWEYQMIFGMAEPFQEAVLRRGRRLLCAGRDGRERRRGRKRRGRREGRSGRSRVGTGGTRNGRQRRAGRDGSIPAFTVGHCYSPFCSG